MKIKNYKGIKGGLIFKNFYGQQENKILDFPVPDYVILPLKQGFGNEVNPVVKIGDRVKIGQIIGIDDKNVSTPIISTISGYVRDIFKKNYYGRETHFILIENDGKEEFSEIKYSDKNWKELSSYEIGEKLYLSGITSCGNSGIPTHFRSSVINPEEVEYVIVHGICSEIYNISLEKILEGKRMFEFVEGIKIIKKLFKNLKKFYLALNKYKEKLIEEIGKLTYEFDWLEIALIEPKYPFGYDEVIIPLLLKKPFPYGYSAANIGVISLNIRHVLYIYETIVMNKPFYEVIIGLCGNGFKENLHLKVRIGTPLKKILERFLVDGKNIRIIWNSLLTGKEISDYELPVDKNSSHLISIKENKERKFLFFLRPGINSFSYTRTFLTASFIKKLPDTNKHGEERPCISCGYCQEVCPVNIIPHLLIKFIRKDIIDERLMNYGIFNCIGCNLCSFVCPSKIQVSQIIKEGQDKLVSIGCDRSQCIIPFFELKGLEEYKGIKKW
ncbi:MAG: 4Fe-4S dicluster domain-containing protein [Candidatus Ratteibacteria bacterium]